MGKFGGLPNRYNRLTYNELKKWFKHRIEKHNPDVDFDKEAAKIGVKAPKKDSK